MLTYVPLYAATHDATMRGGIPSSKRACRQTKEKLEPKTASCNQTLLKVNVVLGGCEIGLVKITREVPTRSAGITNASRMVDTTGTYVMWAGSPYTPQMMGAPLYRE
jgi:hypothetical protein